MCAGKTFSRHVSAGKPPFCGGFFMAGGKEGTIRRHAERSADLMGSSSGEGGLLAEWRSDAVVIPNPKNITPKTFTGTHAGGDWNGVAARANSEKEGLSMAVCVGKDCGRNQVSTEAFGKGGMDLALAGLGKGTFSRKVPFPYASYAFKASLLWNVLLRCLSVPLRFFKGAVPVDGGNQDPA